MEHFRWDPRTPRWDRAGITSMSLELISALAGLILTLMIFSYLIGDSPLFRIAVYLFIGVASGYAATVVWHQVLVPKLLAPLQAGSPNQLLFIAIPLILCLSLLAKLSPRISWIGNVAMAILVGVGAAAAIGWATQRIIRIPSIRPISPP